MAQRISLDDSAGAVAAPHLFVTLLGHLKMEVDGKPFPLTTRRKTLPLLAYLLLHRHENLTRDFVAFLLWPDESEEDARAKLRSNLHELSRALPPEGDVPWLLISSTNLRWNPAASLELDVERFEHAANAPNRLEEALELYSNDLLQGADDEWIVAERERLQLLFFAALERGIARASRSGDLGRAISYAQRLLARDPFREDVLRRLMALRDASGDRSGALADYRKFETHVRRELGVDPMPETIAFRDQIARGDAPFASDAGDEGEPQAAARTRADPMPLVGREDELERLAAVWSKTRGSRGGVVFVGGEAGIGKSRLIAQFASDVVHRGGRVMTGGTSAPEAGPFQAFVEALRSALPLVAALQFEPLWKQTLATLVPELTANDPVPALPTLAVRSQADRVHEAIGRALVALARTRPLLVVLEDLHWASGATVEALGALARRIALAPIAIVVTYRDDELERSHPLASAIRDLGRDGLAQTLPLRALSVEEVVELARRANVPVEEAAAIHRVTEGNAFFIGQLLASDARDHTVPAGVFEAVTARFERLPEAAQHIAEIAALAGTNFSGEIVGGVAGWNAAEVGDALDVLIERRFVRERPGRGPFNLAFAHELVRQTILGIAPGSPDRHRRVARVIEACHPELAGELALELAVHYERAGAPLEAAHRYARAARRALELGAPADAEAALASGLALDLDARTRAGLYEIALEADARGDTGVQLERVERLEELAAELDDDELRVSALSARLQLYSSVGDDLRVGAAAAAAVVRARASEKGVARWLAVADMTDALIGLTSSDAARSRELFGRSLAVFRELGDESGATRCLGWLANIEARGGNTSALRRICDELEEWAARSTDYLVKSRALVAAYNAIATLGFDDDCSALTTRWIALAREAGDLRHETAARENHARSLLIAGRGGAALESIEAALAVARSIGLDGYGHPIHVNYATVLHKLGAFTEAIPIFERVRSHFESRGERHSYRSVNVRSVLSLALAYSGDVERARATALDALASSERLELHNNRSIVLENLAEIERCGGDHAAAFAYADNALDLRTSFRAPLTKQLVMSALAAARSGRGDAARERLARIADDEREVFQGTYWRERTALQLAQTAHLCGDDARAQRWLAVTEREIAATLDGLAEPWRSHYLAAWWSKEAAAARASQWPERG